MKRSKAIIGCILTTVLLSGCLSGDFISNTYELENVMEDGANNQSSIYRAEGSTVPEVAETIQGETKPEDVSSEDEERMFLVYQDRTVQVMEDPENQQDALVEVSEKEFVENNYSPSLLETYAMYRIIGDLYNMGGQNRDRGYEGYVGTGGNYHKNPGNKGSNRSGSVSSTNSRGGGLFSGK
ncbi:DUF4247 domain-containing protein [Salibacterium salarium]|uniref:DUF4247 domain-containing protein n=1 Tax=Salibacterium salarium TaxID=284579 RepID=A0A3R9QM34_9BACI|nr:DUF4247 domain-containing protein [Salibacterium salarium]RSL33362.1 DUF4247 domain-containing protein [Salibacterium salarium]